MTSTTAILPSYVMTDLSVIDGNMPCGRRGYIVIREGTRYVTLFCPRSFTSHKIALDQWDAIEIAPTDYDAQKLAARLAADRIRRRQGGHYDGGRNCDRVLQWLASA